MRVTVGIGIRTYYVTSFINAKCLGYCCPGEIDGVERN